jgi:tRNA 2-thiouridine synthesizing protein A
MSGFANGRALHSTEPELIIDARGHRCPVPTLRLRKALEGMGAGQRVRLLADDPMARVDVPHFTAETGDVLVESGAEGKTLSFLVEKRGAAPRS